MSAQIAKPIRPQGVATTRGSRPARKRKRSQKTMFRFRYTSTAPSGWKKATELYRCLPSRST